MDYKQKYEQALENIKKIKSANKDNKALVDFIEYEYPELKESEDERIRKLLIGGMKYLSEKNLFFAEIPKDKVIAWLEKQGEQKPVEWSEEDERMINRLIKHFDWGSDYRFDKNDCDEAQDWLKSLKPQPHWKPSEEQMGYMKKVYESYYFCDGERCALESLYNDLKKL